MTQPTPTPWRVYAPDQVRWTIRAKGQIISGVIASVNVDWMHEPQRKEQRANARLIVRAVNSHDAVVEALEKIAAPMSCGCDPCRGQCRDRETLAIIIEEFQDTAEAALALARGDAA